MAERQQVDVAALRTCARHPLDVAAVVATQLPRVAMHDQARAAARASGLPAAGRAEQRRREPAAVDEDERLLAATQPRLDRREQRRAHPLDGAGIAVGDEDDRRQARAARIARSGSLSQR